jgi:hypothetical protein
MSGFGNIFSSPRRLTKSRNELHGRAKKKLGGFSQLESDFIEARDMLNLDDVHKIPAKNWENHQRSYKKYDFVF